MVQEIKIALAGNPNSGKTSLFNQLTGLNQKVGNFPGVTVEKKVGSVDLDNQYKGFIIDIPGIYGLYPRSEDEYVAHSVLIQKENINNPDVIVVLADASNLKRNLLLCSQIIDIQKPTILAITMMDIAKEQDCNIDTDALSKALGIPVVTINPRNGSGIPQLKETIINVYNSKSTPPPFLEKALINDSIVQNIQKTVAVNSWYGAMHIMMHAEQNQNIHPDERKALQALWENSGIKKTLIQSDEILERYKKIDTIIQNVILARPSQQKETISQKLDKWFLHPIGGYFIMFGIMFLVFQCLFALAAYPMDMIDGWTNEFKIWVGNQLPNIWWANLITEGIISGIGGVVIFVPQIAILFFLITILEETGYMSRVSFLTDKIMQKVGMNGRSVMPLVSGMACAIPAVMAARTITNPKERLLTILVTPFMSCSARLPVYTLLIAMIVPDSYIGPFNIQGLVMMGMYLLGIAVSLIVSYILNILIKQKNSSFYIMELPLYRLPRWKNAFFTMYEKAKVFVIDAGKIIIMISIVLWFLASYGPPKTIEGIEDKYAQIAASQVDGLTPEQEEEHANELLASSYAGILGHAIEPAIKPLGYDWKIGIALLSSFAAREVFVGTMATLYSVGNSIEEDDSQLREKMLKAKRKDGSPVYTTATGISLLMFYAFAMQCISTIAIVKRETNSWKWPIIQTLFMTGIAYITAWLAFNIFS